jgi:hypothetical protein
MREADTAPEIFESSVGPQRIEGRAQQDGRVESRFIGLVQPDHRPGMIAEPHVDQRDVGVGSRVLIMPGLQVPDYFHCFFFPSRNSVNVGEIGVEGPTVSGRGKASDEGTLKAKISRDISEAVMENRERIAGIILRTHSQPA